MTRPGLCSVTFRQLAPADIIDLAANAGLEGIQWGSDVHLPAGNTTLAREIRSLMDGRGLICGTYGTYYRAGFPDSEPFEALLENALLLGSSALRIWVGRQGSAETPAEVVTAIRRDLDRILELAAARGLVLVMEFHGGVLTDNAETTAALLEAVAHPALRTAWQPLLQLSPSERMHALELLRPWLHELHLFHWRLNEGTIERLPLAEGSGEWHRYLQAAGETARWAWLEFVRDDEPGQLAADAATLREWLAAGTGDGDRA